MFNTELNGKRNEMSGLLCVVVALTCAWGQQASGQWPQWGGPNRNFIVEARGLADAWPDDGPQRLWHRKLGVGYSSIVFDDGVLYTMYRTSRTAVEERTVALDAESGKTLWEHRNPAPLPQPSDARWGGQGPNATPVVAGDHLYAVGSRGVMHCFDKKTGAVHWQHDLTDEGGVPISDTTGQACSPIVYRNSVIVPLGSSEPNEEATEGTTPTRGHTLIALDKISGKVLWKNQACKVRFSSPILVRLGGQDQLLLSAEQGLTAVSPANGEFLWRHPVPGQVPTPVWNGHDLVFYSSGSHDTVGRVLRLKREDGKTSVTELWNSRKVRLLQPTPVLVDGHLVGATDRAMICVNMETGKRTWLKRGFPMASCVYADGKLIILDEKGKLSLATATPERLIVHSQCDIAEQYSLTVPTLVGTTLYVRDRKHILALDLG